MNIITLAGIDLPPDHAERFAAIRAEVLEFRRENGSEVVQCQRCGRLDERIGGIEGCDCEER